MKVGTILACAAAALASSGCATIVARSSQEITITSVPEGAAAWPFWLLAAVNGAFGAGLLVGMGIGGQEKPFV